MLSSFPPPRPTESIHHRLIEFVKTALINIFVSPYATVCDLYCGKVPDEEKWDEAQIGHYIGIVFAGISKRVDVATSGVSEVREAWESRRKAYTSEFLEFDPCIEDVELHWKNKENQADIVFCMQHLPLCVETEEKVRRLLHNVSSLLKPGGYFLGITPDSSTIWAKYQKNVEAYHNKSAGMKPNIFPNCIRSESYMITFEVEEEKFPFFGKKYQLKFAGDMSAETHCLVHFPSLIRLAREAGLEYVEIQNLTEFYDDNRIDEFLHCNTLDASAKSTLLQAPLMPQRDWQVVGWREDDKNVQPEPSSGLGKITEQKGILGPGPAELRFPEAL
ncbi:cap guanine-N7 methyltransferase 2 [Sesamum angolense]|uniref:mRNA cap guanine-N(7) methyltransferase 2 n=1 Tax=Sesamum angolense TaxID=2727404 RepID=A0AAE2BHI0_9LAMI|nr:cap guanine-N7 methyltransferase 2 [Sesamum angolense]